MTIDEAIERCDRMKPNAYSRADKIRWLSELDGRVLRDIVQTHEWKQPGTGETDTVVGETPQDKGTEGGHKPGEAGIWFIGYDENTPGGTALLAPSPYEDIYINYLFMQIDFNNADFTRYNNSAAMFQAVYSDFADAYNRAYIPLQKHSIRI